MLVSTSLGKVNCVILGEGTPVILIHGFACSHVQWMFTSRALAEAGYKAISIDLPGFGLSDIPPSPITTDRYADVVMEVMANLNISAAVLVGSSMGGFVAWLCASRMGDDILGLVLSNSAGAPQSSSLPPRNKRKGKRPMGLAGFPGLSALAGVGLTSPLTRMIVRPTINKAFGDTERLAPDVFEALHSAARQSRIVFRNMLRFSTLTDTDNILVKITCPTLIIWGDKDNIVPIAAMDYFVDQLLHAKLKVYFGVGHLPMLEIPDEFNSDLLGFLASVDGLTNPDSQ